jgi:hypothetical protein
MPASTQISATSGLTLPWFPVELIEVIIAQTWALPLTSKERLKFMTNSLLVNKMWMASFIRISFTDVYIPTPKYIAPYFRYIDGTHSMFDFAPELKSLPNRLCTSLTYMFPNDSLIPVKSDVMVKKGLFFIMQRLQGSPEHIPNLRHFALFFENHIFEELMDLPCFYYFPRRVPELEVEYSFNSRTPAFLVESLHNSDERSTRRDPAGWSLKAVRKLTILGASNGHAMDWIARGPVLETLTLDDHNKLPKGFKMPSSSVCAIQHRTKQATVLRRD